MDDKPRLIEPEKGLSNPVARAVWRWIHGPVERLLGIRAVNDIYAGVHELLDDRECDPEFFNKTLGVMDVEFSVDADDFERIPKTGPLLVVANHPYGGLDGIVLGAVLLGARPDARLFGNYLLNKIDGIRGHLIAVDPFERSGAKASNLGGMRASIRWLREGGCIGTFPAGEVSHFTLRNRAVVDGPWSPHTVALAVKTGATVLPLYFEGCNSWLFQLAGLLHSSLRTVLLPRELGRMRGRRLTLRVGTPVPSDRLEAFADRESAAEYLRLVAYSLSRKSPSMRARLLRFPFRPQRFGRAQQPLAQPEDAGAMRAEMAALSPEALLVEQGSFRVYTTGAAAIPVVMREIARLREETFRAVGEGTGRASDSDAFDEYYQHLFMWDEAAGAIVGAYRIGLTDRILKTRGRSGLYCSTLFRFKPGFLENLGPAMELGRSFISLGYQKKHASLALIWRGIGEYIVRNPDYHILFGPVSITDAYQKISKNLMVHFLREHSFDRELARQVRAKKPPKAPRMHRGISLEQIAGGMKTTEAVSAVVSGFETDQKGLPILLRHYLKLNGVLLSLNVDPDFNHVIDGLILVDVRKTDPKLRQRFMGKEGNAAFAGYHKDEV